jgi:hypothetical protein
VANYFRELRKGEVRRIPLPRTSVNKGMKKGRGCCYAPASFSRVGLPLPLLLPWRSIRRLTRLVNRLHALLGT